MGYSPWRIHLFLFLSFTPVLYIILVGTDPLLTPLRAYPVCLEYLE
jgi:hypothetical protein